MGHVHGSCEGLRGSKPMSPGEWVDLMDQRPSFGFSNEKTEKTSKIASDMTTGKKAPCSGVSWNAMYDGTSMLPPKSGWKFSATRKPSEASMATRLHSTARIRMLNI